MDSSFLIYGANGYTGELIARAARGRGLTPLLAARREAAVRPLADELGLAWRCFALDDAAALDAGLAGVRVVLHCAGPFSHTSRPMAEACLRTGVHYLDVTGEVAVFEALAARDAEAKRAGIMLLPGVGFDVVPSDCLAAHLKRRLPSATHLRLGFQALMSLSRGTANSTIEGFGLPNLVRRGGVLTPQPMGALTRQIDFGAGPVPAVSIPWGDVSTAYYSTAIPNIEVYTTVPAALRIGMRVSSLLRPLLQAPNVQAFLKRRVQAGKPGPNSAQRARGRSLLWGQAEDRSGQVVVTRIQAPEGYTLTVDTALASVARVLAGEAPAGFQTPSLAYGADFILQMPGVQRLDV
jgi:short subunit dehydrogenase-like uncharacterized protein